MMTTTQIILLLIIWGTLATGTAFVLAAVIRHADRRPTDADLDAAIRRILAEHDDDELDDDDDDWPM